MKTGQDSHYFPVLRMLHVVRYLSGIDSTTCYYQIRIILSPACWTITDVPKKLSWCKFHRLHQRFMFSFNYQNSIPLTTTGQAGQVRSRGKAAEHMSQAWNTFVNYGIMQDKTRAFTMNDRNLLFWTEGNGSGIFSVCWLKFAFPC